MSKEIQFAEELKQAQCAVPFDLLGMHEDSRGGMRITAWYPGAEKIEALKWDSGDEYGSLVKLDDAGLFELHLPKQKAFAHYQLRVHFETGDFMKLDPYQFGLATFGDLYLDYSRLYDKLGSHLHEIDVHGVKVKGVKFAVYAPNARAVSVIGDFNAWDGRALPMGSCGDGVWRLFVPDLVEGQGYKFEITSHNGDVLPHKIDPYGYSIDQFPSFATRIYDQDSYQWQDKAWQDRPQPNYVAEPMSIYEGHLSSWRRYEGEPLSYAELARDLIPYIQKMGYTHIELMPISEYPFDGSWGYQPVGMFAPTSRFGGPDDFKAFVDLCHQANIGIILDWVPAHFPTDAHGLANFDGTPLYEYPDPRRGWHKDWNSLIYDYGRTHVCDFLVSNALYWFDKFHIDGIRVDAVASMLYLDYAREHGEWLPNVDGGNHNYEAINFLKRLNESIYGQFPKAVTIAEESTAFPGVSKPTYEGGLGFGFKWNMGWMNDGLHYMAMDHVYRSYHHSELTFSMIYAFDENFVLPLSHDEVVHGKRSLLDKMPGDGWQKFANLRAYMGYMYAHPGKKLNFMGNEFAQGIEWNYNQSLDWHLLENASHLGQQTLMADLNKLYTSEPSLYQQDYSSQGFSWLAGDDGTNSVLSFVRFAEDANDHLIVLVNFTPVPRESYGVGAPYDGEYEVVLNSDDAKYSGSDFNTQKTVQAKLESLHGQPCSIVLDIPPLSTVILKPKY